MYNVSLLFLLCSLNLAALVMAKQFENCFLGLMSLEEKNVVDLYILSYLNA
jgi:hypothetical protein